MHIEQWGEPSRTIDFYDVKSDIEVLYRSKEVEFQSISHPAFHPGKSAQVMMGAKPVGWLGELHPHWQKKYDIAKPVILFELILDSLVPMQLMQVKETAKFPPVRRDIAVVVDNQINVQSIISSLYEKKPAVVTEIALFDIYRGKSVGENKKSLAFRVILQDVGRTLTDEDADLIIANLLQVLATKFDAILRN